MKLSNIHNITFEEKVLTATLSKPEELIILFSTGNVVRFDLNTRTQEVLFHLENNFDLEGSITIYTLGTIIVVANNFKRHACIHYPDKYKQLDLRREDYHADISYYPIALFKDKNNIPHIIFSQAWNHVQIMNLDTRQVLTASKSLIKVGAEKRRIEFYKKHKEFNKLPWPNPYDYFYGELKMSPDQQHFLSAGWAWGSCDAYNIYNVKDFISNHRISDIYIDSWEHENRANCWVDDRTVAVAYDPIMEDDDGATKDTPNEIHFYKLSDKVAVLDKKVAIKGLKIVSTSMYYSESLNALILFSSTKFVVLSLESELLYENNDLRVNSYFKESDLLLTVTDEAVEVNRLEANLG